MWHPGANVAKCSTVLRLVLLPLVICTHGPLPFDGGSGMRPLSADAADAYLRTASGHGSRARITCVSALRGGGRMVHDPAVDRDVSNLARVNLEIRL